jgi:hypothetical protein
MSLEPRNRHQAAHSTHKPVYTEREEVNPLTALRTWHLTHTAESAAECAV